MVSSTDVYTKTMLEAKTVPTITCGRRDGSFLISQDSEALSFSLMQVYISPMQLFKE